MPVYATMVRVAVSKDYTLEPGFNSLHLLASKTMLSERTAETQEQFTVLYKNLFHVMKKTGAVIAKVPDVRR